MKLSRQKLIYLGLLGLGLSALVVDRVLLTPSGAEAAQPADPEPSAATAPAPRAEPVDAPPPGKPLSERLRQAKGDAVWPDVVTDGFSPPPAWVASAPMGPPAPDSSPGAPSENFSQPHKITGVLTVRTESGDRVPSAVIIDGKPYKVGSELEGFRLEAIDAKGAEFATTSGRIRLDLARP